MRTRWKTATAILFFSVLVAGAAADEVTGIKEWEFTQSIDKYPIIDFNAGHLFVDSENSVYKVNKDSSYDWEYNPSVTNEISAIAATSSGPIYIGRSDEGKITKVSSSGSKVWTQNQYDYEDDTSIRSLAVDSSNNVYIGSVVVDKVVKLDSSGTKQWVENSPSSAVQELAVDNTNNYVYAGTSDGYLYKYSLSGNLVYSKYIQGGIQGLDIGPNQNIYLSARQDFVNYLYKLNPDGSTIWQNNAGLKVEVNSEGTAFLAAGSDGIMWSNSTGYESSFFGPYGEDIAVGDSGGIYSSDNDYTVYKTTENFLPDLQSNSFNDSNPSLGDSVRFEANVSDQDGTVNNVHFKITKNGTVVFDGSATKSSGLWVSDPIKVNKSGIYYNATVKSATDDQGSTNTYSSSNEDSFYVTGAPRLTGSFYVDDRKRDIQNLSFKIDDLGERDIAGYSGISSVHTFSNKTLNSSIAVPFDVSVNVSDSTEFFSRNWDLDIETSETAMQEDDYAHSLANQRINKTISVSNYGFDWVEYNLSMESYGTTVSGVQSIFNLTGGSTTSNTGVWEGDWISVGGESSNILSQNSSKLSSLDTQYLYNQTELEIDNSQSFSFSGVNISSVCSISTSVDVPSGTSIVTDSCNNKSLSGDYITDEGLSVYHRDQNTSKHSNLSEQHVFNQTSLSVNNNQNFSFSDVDLSSICSFTTSSDVPSGSSTLTDSCNNESYSGDWISDVSKYTIEQGQNSSAVSTLQTQYLANQTGLKANNTRSFNFSQVDISSKCDNTTTTDIPSGYGTVTENCLVESSQGDWISNEQIYGNQYSNGNVIYGGDLNQNYTANQSIYGENTNTDIDFNINFTENLTQVNQCSLKNNAVKQIPALTGQNSTFDKTCNPGKEISYTPVSTKELDDGRTKYNYSVDVKVFSNLVDEERHSIAVPQSRLDNWEDRNGDETEGYVNGSSNDITTSQAVLNSIEYTLIEVGDQYGNSSLHQGRYTATLVYYEGGDSSTGSPSGGGGLPSDDSTSISFEGVNFTAVPGTSSTKSFTIVNSADSENSVGIDLVSGQDCRYFSVQQGLGSDSFGSSGSYSIPSSSQSLSGDEYRLTVEIEVEMPEAQQLSEDEALQCEALVSTSTGNPAPLSFTARQGNPVFQNIIPEINLGIWNMVSSVDWSAEFFRFSYCPETGDSSLLTVQEGDSDGDGCVERTVFISNSDAAWAAVLLSVLVVVYLLFRRRSGGGV